jgi:tRNA A37 threonylcarbamoyladenosine synthetase subunit TsaC/SUA5/YrdC
MHLADARDVARLLDAGNVALYPSDTCYGVAVRPFFPCLTQTLDVALGRRGEKISLGFYDLSQVETSFSLQVPERELLDDPERPAVTVVAYPRRRTDRDLAKTHLFSDGSVGVRVSGSGIERQLARVVGGPLTTIAVRDGAGAPITDLPAAHDVVETSLQRIGWPGEIAVIDARRIRADDVSTVVRLETGGFRVLRPGAGDDAVRDAQRSRAARNVRHWERP